jgi:hypothetical protein
MIPTGQPTYSEKNLSHCHFVDHKSYLGLVWNRVEAAVATSWRLTASCVAQRYVQHVGRISEMYDKACIGGQIRYFSAGRSTSVQTCSVAKNNITPVVNMVLDASLRINDQF